MNRKFDSRQYEFADITLIMGGVDIASLRKVSYTRKIEREPVHGKGRRPMSIQSGNITVEGEVGLLQSDLELLIAASPRRDILNANVDILVCYGGNLEEGAGTLLTDRIEGVRFTESSKGMSQGDKWMDLTLPFVALDVKNQV